MECFQCTPGNYKGLKRKFKWNGPWKVRERLRKKRANQWSWMLVEGTRPENVAGLAANPPHTLQIQYILYSLQFLFLKHTLQIQSVLYDLISVTILVSTLSTNLLKGPFLLFPTIVQFFSIYYNLWFSVSPIVSHKMPIRWAMKRIWYVCTHCFALCQIGERCSEWGGFACFCGSLNCLSTLCLHPLPQCWPPKTKAKT